MRAVLTGWSTGWGFDIAWFSSVKMFDADKTRMIGLPYGEKTMTIC